MRALGRTLGQGQEREAAGRELFAVSRKERSSTNDADRLRKYLARFGLSWERVTAAAAGLPAGAARA